LETPTLAGKSWHPSHETPPGRETAGTNHADKTVEREGRDREGETSFEQRFCARDSMLKESADNAKLLERLVAQEHVES